MSRTVLRDDQWDRIKDLLPGKAGDRGVTAADNRLFVEAVLWLLRTGAPWRDLPPEFGRWHTAYMRFARWHKNGVWEGLFRAVRADADLEEVFIDSTAIRAHRDAAGRPPKNGARSLGGSRGGWGPPIPLIGDALGNPLVFTLSGAEQAEMTQAQPLIDAVPHAQAVIADKGYGADDGTMPSSRPVPKR